MSQEERFDPTIPILLTGEYQCPLQQENSDQIQIIANDESVNPLISYITNQSLQKDGSNDAPQTSALPVLW